MKFRLKAFLYHLAISVLIASISAMFVFLVLYPAPFDKAVGVTKIYLLVLTVDVIAGPLMTLILAKPNKKGLKFDLTCIALVQAMALSYGLYSIVISRPVWIVFDQVRFDLVLANDIDHSQDWLVTPKYQQLSMLGPKYVAVRKPVDDSERNNWLFYNLSTGFAPSMRPRYYEPLDNAWNRIKNKQYSVKSLYNFNQKNKVDTQLAKFRNAKITGWLPLNAYEQPMTILLDTDNKKIVGIVEVNPF